MMLFTLECISFNNIRAHALVLWVNSQRSNRSDHDTRISYHGWVASKQSLQAPPPPLFFFLSPSPRSNSAPRFARRFSFSPRSGSLFAGYFRLLCGLSVSLYLLYIE